MKARAKADPANQNPDRVNNNTGPVEAAAAAGDVGRSGPRSPPPTRPAPPPIAYCRPGAGQGKGNIAGFVMGMFLVAVGLNVLENGPAAGWDWVKANSSTKRPRRPARRAPPAPWPLPPIFCLASAHRPTPSPASPRPPPGPEIAPLQPGQTAPPLGQTSRGVNRVLVVVLGVWVIAQVTKGNALERLGIITPGSTPATPKTPNYTTPAPGSNAGAKGPPAPGLPTTNNRSPPRPATSRERSSDVGPHRGRPPANRLWKWPSRHGDPETSPAPWASLGAPSSGSSPPPPPAFPT